MTDNSGQPLETTLNGWSANGQDKIRITVQKQRSVDAATAGENPDFESEQAVLDAAYSAKFIQAKRKAEFEDLCWGTPEQPVIATADSLLESYNGHVYREHKRGTGGKQVRKVTQSEAEKMSKKDFMEALQSGRLELVPDPTD